MKNLILAVMLLGLSANVYSGDKDPKNTGPTDTLCEWNKNGENRDENPEAVPAVVKAVATPIKIKLKE